MSEKHGEFQPESNDDRRGESHATDTQLVCRIAGISDSQRIRPFPEDLNCPGVAEHRLMRLRAACELHRRLVLTTVAPRVPLTFGQRLLKYLTEQYADQPAEVRRVHESCRSAPERSDPDSGGTR